MRQFGLIGYPLSHSFSKGYFAEKFQKEGIFDAKYETFPLENIEMFPGLIASMPELCGLNVTIPYKEKVIPFLDELEEDAAAMGAVNTILFRNGTIKGFNTDVYGFQKSLEPLLKPHHTKALVLGTGGAAKAVIFALKKIGIAHQSVSRTAGKNILSYADLNEAIIQEHSLIIQTTPLGMYPATENCPDIPYSFLNQTHLLYDLVYNPSETLFLKKGIEKGAKVKNGLEMLHLQAERAWFIWNNIR